MRRAKYALAIGAAMRQSSRHFLDERIVPFANRTCNAAHKNMRRERVEIPVSALARGTPEHYHQAMMRSMLRRRGFWSGRLLSRSFFFTVFLKPLVLLDVLILERSQYWPQDAVRSVQWHRIRRLLQTAYRNAPFWKSHLDSAGIRPDDIQMWSDFPRIPVIRKDDLRGKPQEILVNSTVPPRWLFRDSTSGSTGVPFQFVVDRSFVLRGLAVCRRMFRMLGWRRGDAFVRFSASDRPGLCWGNYFFLVPHGDVSEDLAGEFAKRYSDKTLIIYSYTSCLLGLARLLSRISHGVRFRAAIATGETMSDAQKQFVEGELRCPVSRCYATRELGWIAQECLSGGLHVNSEWCYVEIVDEAGMAPPSGQSGRIVVTTFDNEAMPFIRYDTGDTGEILPEPCPCGRTLPLIKFHGRQIGILRLPGGRTLHHMFLFPPFYDLTDKIRRFQIVQESADQITISIVSEPGFSSLDVVMLKTGLLRILGPGVTLAIKRVDAIAKGPRGKDITFLSKLVHGGRPA